MNSNVPVPVVLTIAGSDSGGGAGIQADLKTFCAMRVFGSSALACITAQNPDKVSGVVALDPAIVSLQIDTVCEAFPIAAAKTGMLYSAGIIEAVAEAVKRNRISPLVVDPVMVSTSGVELLHRDALRAMKNTLFPIAFVITPNVPEAEILLGKRIRSAADLRSAAASLADTFGCACALKGGHLKGDVVLDVLFSEKGLEEFSHPRIKAVETHGTGCAFSAGVAALLARGESLGAAVKGAADFVRLALLKSMPAGPHSPLNFFPNG